MKNTLFPNAAAILSRGLTCVALLLLVGCGKTTEIVAHDSENSHSPSTPQADSKLDAIGSGSSAKRQFPPAPKQPAQPPVDVPKFMDDALNGNADAVEQAVAAGVDVNAVDEEKRTALMLAAFNGHVEIVKLLLDHDAKLSERDSMGRTPLMFAATGDNAAACEALLAAGADVNATDTGEGFTALMHAAAEGQLEVVKVLLQHNADRSRRDIDGDTAQSFAEKNGHTEVVKMLAK